MHCTSMETRNISTRSTHRDASLLHAQLHIQATKMHATWERQTVPLLLRRTLAHFSLDHELNFMDPLLDGLF